MTTANAPHTSIDDGIMLDRLIDPMVDAIAPLLAEGSNPLPLAEKMATAAADSFRACSRRPGPGVAEHVPLRRRGEHHRRRDVGSAVHPRRCPVPHDQRGHGS